MFWAAHFNLGSWGSFEMHRQLSIYVFSIL